jgi:hypothetical protein
MSYPSSFHSLVAVSAEGSEVAAQCIVRDTASDMPLKHETSYKLHPAVIDAMLQVPLLGPETKTEGGIETANIPCSIRHISLPSRWGQKTGDRFAIRAAAEPKTTSSMVELFTEQSLSAAISIAGLKFRRLKSVPRAAAAPRELCFKLNWEPLREAKPSAPGNANAAKGRAGVVIVTDGVERANDPVIAALSREIKKHTGVLAKICPLQDISDWTSHFIIMAEIWRPLLCAIDETSLGQVRKLLTKAPGLMWVTRGAARFPTAPNLNMAIGLVRTARS